MLISCVAPQGIQFSARVDGLTSSSADIKRTYILAPGLKDISSGDLQFKEFAEYVHKVLGQLGFIKAEDIDSASSIIYLSYGISDPQKTAFSYILPIWGRAVLPLLKQRGEYSFFGKTVSYSGTTTYTPQYGIAGSYSGYGVLQHLSKICNA